MSFVIALLFLVLSPSNSSAELKTICFYEPDAAEMVVQLENYDKEVEINAALKEKIVEMEKVIDNSRQQIELANTTIQSMTTIVDDQKEAYEKQLKEVTPSFIDNMLKDVGLAAVIFGVIKVATLFI